MSDPVQAPSHYVAGEFECIEVMRAVFTPEEFRAHCLCTAFAYLWRHGRKDGEPIERDVAKAARYLEWAQEVTVPERSGVTPQSIWEERDEWRLTAANRAGTITALQAKIEKLKAVEEQRDKAIKERDKWYQAYSDHAALIVRLQAKIAELTAKAPIT